MILYLDTSLLVAAFTAEMGSERLIAWMAGATADDFAIGPWTRVEYASALSIKLRTRQIDDRQREAAMKRFAQMAAESFLELPATAAEFDSAARLCADRRSGVRAGDALHLAVAMKAGAVLCTLDRRLAEAGARMKARILLV